MSVKVMGLVWDAPLPRDEKFLLLAYADFSDHGGGSIWPSKELVTRMTGYSIRSVQSITAKLNEYGLLLPDGKGPKGVIRYRIDLQKLRALGGADFAPPSDARGADGNLEEVQPDAERGADPAPNPSEDPSGRNHHTPAVPAEGVKVTSDHATFIADWMLYYERRTNQKYPFRPIDAKAVKTLLTHFHGLDPAKAFIKACHVRSKEGFPFGATETLPDLANGIARLQAALATPPKRNGHGPQPSRAVCPSHDDEGSL